MTCGGKREGRVMSESNLRNLDQLQEDDDERHVPKGVTAALVVLGGGCVVFAALALGGRTSQVEAPKTDPLGDLVSRHSTRTVAAPSAPPTELLPRDVTFPGILSDQDKPTTALAAVHPVAMASPAP